MKWDYLNFGASQFWPGERECNDDALDYICTITAVGMFQHALHPVSRCSAGIGIEINDAMVGACYSVRARRGAPATSDCLMARMVTSKP